MVEKESKGTESKTTIMQLLIAFLLVGLMGIGGGIGLRTMLDQGKPANGHTGPNSSKPSSAAAGTASNETGSKTDTAKGKEQPQVSDNSPEADVPPDMEFLDDMSQLTVTPMEPVITNIASPKGVWIRLEGSILSRTNATTKPQVLAAQAAQQVVLYFRSLELRQIEGANGLLHVNEDLNEIAKSFSDGDVRGILISGFIVE